MKIKLLIIILGFGTISSQNVTEKSVIKRSPVYNKKPVEVRKGLIHWEIPSLQVYSGVAKNTFVPSIHTDLHQNDPLEPLQSQQPFTYIDPNNNNNDDENLASVGSDIYASEDYSPAYNGFNEIISDDDLKSNYNQNIYNDIGNYYLNGSDLLTQTTEQDFPLGYGINQHDFIPPFHKTEFSLETSGAKLVVLIATLWYLLLAVWFQASLHNNNQKQQSLGPSCAKIDQLYTLHASNNIINHSPSDSELQEEIFGMFTSNDNNEGSSEENLPDISQIGNMCSRNAFFYGMNHNHMMAVNILTDMFMEMPSAEAMMGMAKGLKGQLNPKVWFEALMKASYMREDMHGMIMPPAIDAMPDTFVPTDLYSYRRRSSKKSNKKKCIRVDGRVGVDNGQENELWYFREDIMVNSHHWYWHLAHPLVNKVPIDRRGELFYFTHHSMTARYNIERLCNGLELTKPFEVIPGAEIFEGYNPHLTDHNAGMPWTPRPPHTPISDIFHEENPEVMQRILIKNWARIKKRLISTIDSGYFVTPKGRKRIPSSHAGIDILANTIEAVDLSINPDYYDMDGFHNNGHRVIGYAVDPHFNLMLPPGAMADPATAMRDPIFYRWHTTVNNIFEHYKHTLKPYPFSGPLGLSWPGVAIASVKVLSKDGPNELTTFMGKRKFPLSLGLAFNKTEDDDEDEHLNICATHLNHHNFNYEIVVDRLSCAKSHSGKATVRIFIAPKYTPHGQKLTIQQQKKLFVHLDLFTVELPPGRSVITRSSVDSSLTIPYQQSLHQLKTNKENNPNCGCGWPHHLLLPRGSHEGTPFDLFVMLTNYDEDEVEENPFPHPCGKAFIYCGIPHRKYPDNKPMGFPFDRDIPYCRGISGFWGKILCPLFPGGSQPFVHDFIRNVHNAAVEQVVIRHLD